MNGPAPSMMEIDDLLERLYRRLKGRKEGLYLVEPAVILLKILKGYHPGAYKLNLIRFSPVIIDIVVSHAKRPFSYRGLLALIETARDIPFLSGEYAPDRINENLQGIESRIADIESALRGERASAGNHHDLPADGTARPVKKPGFESVTIPRTFHADMSSGPLSTESLIVPQVTVKITGEWSIHRKHAPVITFDHISADPGSSFREQIVGAVTLAEKYASSRLKIRTISRTPREYHFSIPDGTILPDSAPGTINRDSFTLAIAVMIVTAIGSLGFSRVSHKVPTGTSISGGLDGRGKILPVEKTEIEGTVKAAFFSTCDTLALPGTNLKEAESVLAGLQEDHPDRGISLVGIAGSLSDCLDGPPFISSRRFFVKTWLSWICHWRKHLVTGLSTLALLVLIGSLAFKYSDRTVAHVRHIRTELVFTDALGREITRHDIGFHYIQSQWELFFRPYIGDYDKDGEKEVHYIYSQIIRGKKSSEDEQNLLHFYRFDEDGILTDHLIVNPADSLSDPGFQLATTNGCRAYAPHLQYTDRSGDEHILILYQSPFRPSTMIFDYSLTDGTTEFFFHLGFIFNTILDDFDGDGRVDLVATAENDLLNSWCILILDPDHIRGASPACARYKDPRYAVDIAKYYIRLPDYPRNSPMIKSDDRKNALQLVEQESGFLAQDKSSAFLVKYSFSGSPVCRSVQIRRRTSVLRPYPPIDMSVLISEAEELRSGLEYWNGSEWVKEPTANQSYLDHISNIAENESPR